MICDGCAGNEEIKCIGLFIPAPHPCAVCGKTLEARKNGFSSGNPVTEHQLDRLRAARGLAPWRWPPRPPARPDLRVGDGYVLRFDDGQAELHLVTVARKTERGDRFVVATFEQTRVETRGDIEAVRIAARQLGITEERLGHRFLVTMR